MRLPFPHLRGLLLAPRRPPSCCCCTALPRATRPLIPSLVHSLAALRTSVASQHRVTAPAPHPRQQPCMPFCNSCPARPSPRQLPPFGQLISPRGRRGRTSSRRSPPILLGGRSVRIKNPSMWIASQYSAIDTAIDRSNRQPGQMQPHQWTQPENATLYASVCQSFDHCSEKFEQSRE